MALNTQEGTIVIADDEPEVRDYLETALRCQGFNVHLAENGDELMTCLGRLPERAAAVILDLMMPVRDGLETLVEIRRLYSDLPVIVLSATSSTAKAAEAMKLGATEFLAKPVSHRELVKTIGNVLEQAKANQTVKQCQTNGGAFVFSGEQYKQVQKYLHQIARSDAPVLLQGETGVGKEVIARQLHLLSRRADRPFVKVNCVALPSELVESELFGYERGAFTGAFRSKPGKFELADGGTILLDEIGDMDVKLQAKLLLVLQDLEYQRLGGKDSIRVNVRVMSATNCDLEKAIQEGKFREDLYFRLNVIKIALPPLRSCKDEIIPLARFLLGKHAHPATRIPAITPEFEEALLSYRWPGNIRELENLMRRFLVLEDPAAVVGELRSEVAPGCLLPAKPDPVTEPGATTQEVYPDCRIWERIRQTEREAILEALRVTKWNRKKAAKLLNLRYKPFLYKMKKLGIDS